MDEADVATSKKATILTPLWKKGGPVCRQERLALCAVLGPVQDAQEKVLVVGKQERACGGD